jgi:CRP-like cAMP-binding protein
VETDLRFIGPLERAMHLKSVEPLAELAPRELAAFARYARERFHGKGEAILSPGVPVDRLHVVIQGAVHAVGGEHGDALIGPGGTLGYLGLLAGDVSDLEATAEIDTVTLEIEKDALEDVFEDSIHLLYAQVRSLSGRLLEERKNIADGTVLAPDGESDLVVGKGADLIARIRYLRRGDSSPHANLDAMVEMARRMTELTFESGETLWQTGDPSGFMVLITGGKVECTLPDGRRFIAGSPYPLGNLESQCGELRWYHARALGTVHGLRADTQMYLDILEDHFEMARDFLAALARNSIRVLAEKRKPSS